MRETVFMKRERLTNQLVGSWAALMVLIKHADKLDNEYIKSEIAKHIESGNKAVAGLCGEKVDA